MNNFIKILKADNGKLSNIIEYASGTKVEIPINSDGSVKWFDDDILINNEKK